jgi:hypothetical protein
LEAGGKGTGYFGLRLIIKPSLRADNLLTAACDTCASWI